MNIIKRDGTEILFDKTKIFNAISKANDNVNEAHKLTVDQITEITDKCTSRIEANNFALNVEEIQEIVEEEIMAMKGYEVAQKYIRYRYEKNLQRKGNNPVYNKIISIVECKNEEVNQENSNKNAIINSTQRDYIAGEVSKDMAKKELLPKEVWAAHEEGAIHFHDADYFVQKMHNCELVNLEDIFQNGTVISDTMIETPKSFYTACNITTQISAQVSSNSYGGQTISLSHLAPFVDVSRKKIHKKVQKELDGLNVSEDRIEKIVEARLKDEVKSGIQTIQYQYVTIATSNGQTPFITLFMYLDEVPEGQTRDDLAMIIEEVLNQRIKGIQNEKGQWITPTFPKLVYCLDEDNIHEDSKYWYLTELAAKCTAKRMVPDYISAKKMRELKGDVYPCMGCVTGDTTVEWSYDGLNKCGPIEDLWKTVSGMVDILVQPAGEGHYYMDTRELGFTIYDCKMRKFVDVLGMNMNSDSSFLEVKLCTGNTVAVTPDHIFTTENRGDVRADELKPGVDIIMVQRDDDDPDISLVESVRDIDLVAPSYDVTTASEHFTINGIYSHNCRSFLTPDRCSPAVGNIAHALNYDESNPNYHKYYGRLVKKFQLD